MSETRLDSYSERGGYYAWLQCMGRNGTWPFAKLEITQDFIRLRCRPFIDKDFLYVTKEFEFKKEELQLIKSMWFLSTGLRLKNVHAAPSELIMYWPTSWLQLSTQLARFGYEITGEERRSFFGTLKQ